MKLKSVVGWSVISGGALVTLTLAVVRGEDSTEQAARRNVSDLFLKKLPWEEHLPDQALIERFNKGKEEAGLEALRQMFIQDKGIIMVAFTHTFPEDVAPLHVDQKRIDRYRAAFRELQIKSITGDADRTDVDFTVSSRGMGSSKGYAWLAEPPKLTAPDLDEYAAARVRRADAAKAAHRENPEAKAYTVYRLIRGNWYLFFSRD